MTLDDDFDRQKLAYHPKELAHWLDHGRTEGPIYTELELANRCNCACVFCGVDHLVKRRGCLMEARVARRAIDGLVALGNKSIMFCGNGEPLLHPQAREIIEYSSSKMSASVTTNGLALSERNVPLVDGLSWIRFSINGCDPSSYAKVQRTSAAAFQRALDAVRLAAERKRRLGLPVTVGVQLVLLDENRRGLVAMARKVRDLGADYFSVKPYSQHPRSRHRLSIDYNGFADLAGQLGALATDSFKVIVRAGAMARLAAPKRYGTCYGTDFMSFISANGDVWECCVFVGDPRFHIGNVGRQTLGRIWKSRRRRSVVSFIREHLSMDNCRDACRLDECNRYLWRLRNPWPHDDFI